MPTNVMEILDASCKAIKSSDTPFGGLRVLAAADMVAGSGCFTSPIWIEAGFKTVVVESESSKAPIGLNNETDEWIFYERNILAPVREGRITPAIIHLLNTTVITFKPYPADNVAPIKIGMLHF